MKTLLFTLEYPPFHGGVANYYGNLVKYWPASAKATAGKPKPDDILVLHNNDGRLINNKLPLLKWLPALFALRRKIKREKIGHVLVGQILPLGAAALILFRFYKIKYSVILHGMDLAYALKRPRKKWLTGKILRRAEKIICANNYTAEMARQFFPGIKSKLAVVNPGVKNNYQLYPPAGGTNYELLKNKYKLNNKIILLSVGRLVKRKGFNKVIEAMPEVLKQVPDLIYVILGNGEESENYELSITNYELENNVLIINRATDQERDLWYNICDIFIMPSRNINGDFEGFGMVYLEANLAGKPVIAGRSGGVGDAVIDGQTGLMVDPENISEITAAVIKLVKDPLLRQQLGKRGRERAIKEFNWEKQVKKIYELIIY